MTQTFTFRKDWTSVDEARRGSTAAMTVYYNPFRPTEVSEKPVNGWIRVSATPHETRYQPQGDYRATVAYGESIFSMSSAMITGAAANNKVGATIPLWVNPLNPTELSLTPRETTGGKRYAMLGLAIAGAVAGIVFLFTNRQWVAPISPASQPTAAGPASSPPLIRPPTIREQLDRIDWYQFEKVCARILERTGSTVERTGGANPDGGADIIARRDGRTAVVQCKFWKRTLVTPKILRELLGTKASAGFAASDAILFSLSDCTEEAKRFAVENGIGVYEAAWIAKTIDDLGLEHFPEITEPKQKFCPRCDAPMVLRDASTPFWGCSNFPTRGCRGKIEMSREILLAVDAAARAQEHIRARANAEQQPYFRLTFSP